jgi:hypothetical protein
MRKQIRFADNEVYDLVYQVLGAYRAGSRELELVANEAFKRISAVGTPIGEKVGHTQQRTMSKSNGPQTIYLLVSERDLVVKALKEFSVPTIFVGLKEEAIAAFENAETAPEGDSRIGMEKP